LFEKVSAKISIDKPARYRLVIEATIDGYYELDPGKCEAQVKEAAARRAKIREACKDKTGEELKSCVREQRQKK